MFVCVRVWVAAAIMAPKNRSLLEFGRFRAGVAPAEPCDAAAIARRLDLPWGAHCRRLPGRPNRQAQFKDMLANCLRSGRHLTDIALFGCACVLSHSLWCERVHSALSHAFRSKILDVCRCWMFLEKSMEKS